MKLLDGELTGHLREPAAHPPRSQRGCLDPETIGRIAREAPPAPAPFVDHLVECPDCAAEYRLAMSLTGWSDDGAARLGVRAPDASRRPRRSAWVVLAASAAATLLLAAGALWFSRHAPIRSPALERGGALPGLRVEPADGAVMHGPPVRFAWSPVAGAAAYRVVLYDRESTPIWKSGALTTPSVELPAQALARLKPGSPCFWRVWVRKGLDEISSPLYEFVVSP